MRDRTRTIRLLSKNLLFIALASVMVIATGAFVIFSIVFLGSSLNSALEAPNVTPAHVQFNVQEFEKLNLIRN